MCQHLKVFLRLKNVSNSVTLFNRPEDIGEKHALLRDSHTNQLYCSTESCQETCASEYLINLDTSNLLKNPTHQKSPPSFLGRR